MSHNQKSRIQRLDDIGAVSQDPLGLFLMLVASWSHNACSSSSHYILIYNKKKEGTKDSVPEDFHLYLIGQNCVTQLVQTSRGTENRRILLSSLCTRGRKERRKELGLGGWISQPMVTSKGVKYPLRGWGHYQWLIHPLVGSPSDTLYVETESAIDVSLQDPRGTFCF